MKHFKIVIFLLSLSIISMELVWTRIFSAEFFYTFAFLILSLAVLGLGIGALFVRLFDFLNRPDTLHYSLLVTGVLMIISPPLTFMLGIDFSQILSNWTMVFKLILIILLLSAAFITGGISLALILKEKPDQIPQLYMADLIGAGIGVAFAIMTMNTFGTPVATFLSSLPVLIAAMILFQKWYKIIPALFMFIGIIPVLHADNLLEAERKERAPVIYKHWDAMSKIKVYDYNEKYRGINIDNIANSTVNAFDGNWDIPDSLKFGFNIVDYIISNQDSCVFLSLGAGGGQDVFQALQYGAVEVHAVEVNKHINEIMQEGDLAEFSGYIYQDPRVKVITEDARVYVRNFENKFDLIYSFSSNSFSAMASGAFAMAENYIFTTEAFTDYWQALTDQGYLIMEHQFYMPRLVSSVMTAFAELNIENPGQHLAVYDLPNMRRNMMILSKQKIDSIFLKHAFGEQSPKQYDYGVLLYPAADSLKDNLINQIISNGWQNVAGQAPVNISPSTDDKPFIAQMGLWQNFDPEKFSKLRGYEDFLGLPLSKIIILIILVIVLVLIMPLTLIPYFMKGEKLRIRPWFYFFFLGLGFMMIEVVLMQKYALFIGTSVYSIITTLITLLIFSGLGSFYSTKMNKHLIFPVIILWIVLDITIFPMLTQSLYGLGLVSRMFITAVLIAPLGFFMGMPFPLAGLKVGKLIDWGFAVNGCASVLGSTIIVYIAFTYGFAYALLTGALMYLCAYLLIMNEKGWTS